MNLIGAVRNFYVCATYSVQYGWQVAKTCCRDGDNFSIISQNHRVMEEKGLRAPFKSKWVSHVLRNAIEETPGLPYQMMCEILKPYFNKYVLTNNVLQEACDTAKGDHLVTRTTMFDTPVQLLRQFSKWVTPLK